MTLLDAFTTCVARYGLDGSTLERISEEAGVGRPLLRHYLGNREEMVAKLLDHVVFKFQDVTDQLDTMLPDTGRVDFIMEALFGNYGHSPEDAAVFQALVAASDRHPEIKQPLLQFVERFENLVARELIADYQKAGEERCRIIATGICGLYFNTDAVRPLGPGDIWLQRQRRAAESLLASLSV